MVSSNRKRGVEYVQYKAAERKEFFKRLDKSETIRAVALELGISPHSAHRRRNEAGVSTRRQVSRRYTAEAKAEFFRRLALHPNVSAVARELEFVRVTCYKWAYAAGIFTERDVSAQRDEFLALRSAGSVTPRQLSEPTPTSAPRKTGTREFVSSTAGVSTRTDESFDTT